MYGYERPRHDNASAEIALLLAIVIVAPGDAHTVYNHPESPLPTENQRLSPPSLSVIADVWC
jgi:hypothetical protein